MAMMTFNMLVERKWLTEKATCGTITAGDLHFFTLEPPTRHDDVKPRAIPAGTYNVTLRFSPKHQRMVPHVEDVPGFEEIEIHWGNYPHDTEGCLLVGETHSDDFVGESKLAFFQLYSLLREMQAEGSDLVITYVDPPVAAPSLVTTTIEGRDQ